ncbi:MAG: hypothetical protein LC799_07730 [Actinobacteria bacterium]|nr:hypothetical protein [Actinomycetota bacterium]MCA1681979.1 hypothetical protein [Actinomycetota bacterium]
MALVAHVAGIYCEEAAVGLLIGHRRWLCREDFLAECVQVGVTEVDVFACVDWTAAVAALKTGRLVCSCSERQVLLLAASLAEGLLVDLRELLTGLDNINAALVADVIAHATGHRRYVATFDGGTAR